MEIRHWYRCDTCSQRYSPQQVQALYALESARAGAPAAGGSADATLPEVPILYCRKKGCPGMLRSTDDVDKDDRG
jgi:hypothetical protein